MVLKYLTVNIHTVSPVSNTVTCIIYGLASTKSKQIKEDDNFIYCLKLDINLNIRLHFTLDIFDNIKFLCPSPSNRLQLVFTGGKTAADHVYTRVCCRYKSDTFVSQESN